MQIQKFKSKERGYIKALNNRLNSHTAIRRTDKPATSAHALKRGLFVALWLSGWLLPAAIRARR